MTVSQQAYLRDPRPPTKTSSLISHLVAQRGSSPGLALGEHRLCASWSSHNKAAGPGVSFSLFRQEKRGSEWCSNLRRVTE